MPDARISIDEFLAARRMHPSRIDARQVCEDFLEEMRRGLGGEPSSLPMIPTYIETTREVQARRTVIALDAGGTNLRVAAVTFDEAGKASVEDLARHRMPGIDAPIGKEEFFRILAGYVLPLADRSERIGFCFSYPAEILPNKDGRLIHFTKEIKAQGVDGQLIGKNLSLALQAAGARHRHGVVLLNDTVATLLAGRNAVPGRRFDDFIGIVCGTGFNASYVERNRLITKARGLDPAGSMVVNTESGSFGRSPTGEIDEAFDAETANPSGYRHEKMISGAYLGHLGLFAAQKAAAGGCFSPGVSRALGGLGTLSTKDLNDFLLRPDSADNPLGSACMGQPEDDRRALLGLVDTLIERAALLVAVTMSAVVLKTDKGKDLNVPVRVTVDGTTYWQLASFNQRVQTYMGRLLSGDRRRAWEIGAVSDAPLLGAAIAALTN